MKNIWKYGRTGGEYVEEVLDDMLVSVPYTDQPPLEGVRADGEPLTIAGQTFDPKLNQRVVLANALDHNDLNSLRVIYEALEHENDNLKQPSTRLMLNGVAIRRENAVLKEKASSLARVNPKMIFTSIRSSRDIAEVKGQLNPEGGE